MVVTAPDRSLSSSSPGIGPIADTVPDQVETQNCQCDGDSRKDDNRWVLTHEIAPLSQHPPKRRGRWFRAETEERECRLDQDREAQHQRHLDEDRAETVRQD